jgi:hypothetical protein
MSRIGVILLTVLVALVPASAQARTRHHRPRPKPPKAATSTPVAISLLPGSTMTFDRQDGSAPRVVAVTGSARSAIKGGYRLSQDNTAAISSGSLSFDPDSAKAAGLPPLTLTLDPRMANRVVIARTGQVTAALGISFAGQTLIIRPTGQIQRETGLSAVTVDSAPQPVTVGSLSAAVSTHLIAKLMVATP